MLLTNSLKLEYILLCFPKTLSHGLTWYYFPVVSGYGPCLEDATSFSLELLKTGQKVLDPVVRNCFGSIVPWHHKFFEFSGHDTINGLVVLLQLHCEFPKLLGWVDPIVADL